MKKPLNPSSQHVPHRRMNLVTVGGSIAVALLAHVSSLHAALPGVLEKRALIAALASAGTNMNDASASQIADAVTSILTNNTRNFRAGVVAGEALKLPASLVRDAGDEIANAVIAASSANPNRALIAGDAAKRAGSGPGPNVNQVPAFSAIVLTSQSEALAAANISRASRTGTGALLGGFASTLPTDTARTSLANAALGTASLLASATEIARFVGREIDGDTAQFAKAIAEANAAEQAGRPPRNIPLRIAPGVVGADPENAGNITDALISSASLPALKRQAVLLANSVGRAADIEQVVIVGKAIADQIGANAGVRLSQAAIIAKVLATAIVSKPTVNGVGKSTPLNKEDELGEVAAGIVAGIIGNTEAGLTAARDRAGKTILAIIKNTISAGALKRRGQIVGTRVQLPTFLFADVAGSVALTIANSNLSAELKASIRAFLLKPAIVRQIGGATFASQVTSALNTGFNNADVNLDFENGFDPISGAITDPETDTRNI